MREFISATVKRLNLRSNINEAEWEVYFMEEAKQALELKSEIDKTDMEIDRMVYEMYGLTGEEIGIGEGE